ncbi:uncharacterized protein Dana_GF11925, isoform G [Drosophila ananassae]|uniref:Uncharacterized protein, isoform G n=1 Tax=Drosophila ananassae TaxID=7217 RepID=A0A0P8YB15_DROAN|nr:uncharacterized protein LOC6494784 isoform X9 [Drosophila ananassae]KPU76248.1 uncharacterized protein Dana_GF11925, isoform G [Drosophila ananassae]
MPAAATTKQRPPASVAEEGMTPKKTALIIVTVIGCIAILWPKVFHPMMFGGVAPPKQNLKDQRAGPGGLRQERPAHLHPESIYQAMRERGRAIPATPTVPIVERKSSPSNPPPRIVDGRPGPIPGMRPPMGAGALHQPQQRGSSMGFLMPLYTIGIVVFFGYTIMKIMFKKQIPNSPYGAAPSDPSFRQEVFGQQNHSQVEDLGGNKLVVTAIQGLIDAADEQLNGPDKLRATSDTESDLNKQNDNNETKEDPSETKQNLSNGHVKSNQDPDQEAKGVAAGAGAGVGVGQQRKRRTPSAERELTVLGMELTASCEGGQKWTGRPPTPVFRAPNEHSKLENLPEPQSIYLEGALAHDSQILVADSQIKREEVYDSELNGSAEEPAVILSSRMTLSLINLDANQQNGNAGKTEVESPLADDIEIIGHDEK